jgi:cytoskeletal protein RodZ
MKFETSAMTIPTLDPNTPRDTKVILNQVGEDYYISKIWVQGKDYGYELPMPNSFKSRQNERTTESSVTGTYQPSSGTDVTTTTPATTTAAAQPAETAPPANANSNNTADTTNRPMADTTPAPATQPAPVETAQSTPPQPLTPDTSADRSMPDQTPADTGSANRTSMPATSAGWLTMLLSGTTLSGAGMMLRRKR